MTRIVYYMMKVVYLEGMIKMNEFRIKEENIIVYNLNEPKLKTEYIIQKKYILLGFLPIWDTIKIRHPTIIDQMIEISFQKKGDAEKYLNKLNNICELIDKK